MAKLLNLGPVKFKAWKLWLLLGVWALCAGIAFAAILFFGSQPLETFDSDNPQSISLRVRDVQIELKRGDKSIAQKRLQDLRQEDPLNPMIHALYGQALAGDPKKLPEAIAATRMAISLDPLFVEAYYNLACYYSRSDEKEQAILALNQANTLGFKDRDQLKNDVDLKPLLSDPRVQHFLNGYALPKTLKYAQATVVPEVIQAPGVIEFTLDIWDLSPPENGPHFRLAYLGPRHIAGFIPGERTGTPLTSSVGEAQGWRLRYRLKTHGAFEGILGPFSLSISGQGVGFQLPAIQVRPAEKSEMEAGFDGAAFFNAPWKGISPNTLELQ